MKKAFITVALLVTVLGLAGVPVFAEDLLSANDLTAGALTASAKFGNFSVTATADKGVSVDPIAPTALTAKDGEIFNQRIKLGGAGKLEYRSIVFTTKGKADIKVYLNSSSKTDARILTLVNAADGSVVAEIPAPVYDDATAGFGTATVPAAGTYFLTPKSSGAYVYAVSVK